MWWKRSKNENCFPLKEVRTRNSFNSYLIIVRQYVKKKWPARIIFRFVVGAAINAGIIAVPLLDFLGGLITGLVKDTEPRMK